MSENTSTTLSAGSVMGVLAIGAALGVAAGILFAPRAGKDTRKYLFRLARDLKEKTEDTLESAKDHVVCKVEKLASTFCGHA